MKKILLFITVILGTALIANFSLWYLNNRMIVQLVDEVKTTLAAQNIELSYEKVVFDTFKSWDLDGAILNLKIAKKPTGVFLNADRVEFQYEQYENALVLKLIGAVDYGAHHSKYGSEFAIKFPDQKVPTLKIKLGKDGIDLGGLFADSKLSKLSTIVGIHLEGSDLKFIDKKMNVEAHSLKSITLDISSSPFEKTDMEVTKVVGSINNWLVSPGYKPEFDAEGINAKFAQEVGPSNIDYKFDVVTNMGEKKQDAYNIESIAYSNDKFKIDTTGTIIKLYTSMIPQFDLKITVNNFSYVYDHYVQYINEIFEQQSKQPSMAITTLKPLDESQRSGIWNIFAEFINSQNELVLQIETKDNGDVYVSSKPFKELFTAFQMIVFRSISVANPKNGAIPQVKVDANSNTNQSNTKTTKSVEKPTFDPKNITGRNMSPNLFPKGSKGDLANNPTVPGSMTLPSQPSAAPAS